MSVVTETVVIPKNIAIRDSKGDIWHMNVNGWITVTQTVGQGATMAADQGNLWIGYTNGTWQPLFAQPPAKGPLANSLPSLKHIDILNHFRLDALTSVLG